MYYDIRVIYKYVHKELGRVLAIMVAGVCDDFVPTHMVCCVVFRLNTHAYKC